MLREEAEFTTGWTSIETAAQRHAARAAITRRYLRIPDPEPAPAPPAPRVSVVAGIERDWYARHLFGFDAIAIAELYGVNILTVRAIVTAYEARHAC